ncbi:prevent-host-death family protein [Oribacterium sp. oral taxon 078 str. F0263]|uniref:phage minor capsid protein n=1 Tax=Oribacterium sp. oral taxon 078 TaxID=652706 RepID=UPI0003AE2F7A|nr:phage minor capsid protein [Oribacterium sp. oral taxon 078]ERL19806.1 prevent-host-death family protein [Oribacterium sp. oral taxon 078 str. F0263]
MDESYHSLLAAGVEKKYRELELSIMKDVVRRIRMAGTITSAADWQIQRLVILGSSSEDIRALISEAVDGNEEMVRQLYEEVIAREYTSQKAIYEAVGKEFIPYEQNAELRQITDALIRQSTEELYNITGSTGFMVDQGGGKTVYTPLSDIYNSYLDDAITGMASGAYDYNTLIRKTTNMMTKSGLRTDHVFCDTQTSYGVDYASGWHNRIDVAVRRALLTGFSQLAGKVTDRNAQQLGTTLFEVSAHAAARPSHAAWQGRVWTKQQLTDVCGLGSGGGLCGWNCHHGYYAFIKGVSQRNYTDSELEEMAAREAERRSYRGKDYNAYEATQKQRQMETALRAKREKVQLLRQAGAEHDAIVEAQCRYQAQLEEYRSFSRCMQLEEQMERVYTGRTPGRISPSPQAFARWQTEQINKEKERQENRRRQDMEAAQRAADHKKWLKDIGATSTTLDTLDKYKEAKHNKAEEYQLLRGYGRAVEKGDINSLVGFEQYQKTAADVQERVVGCTTSDGVRIDSYALHFIDRVIGQTAEPHEGMREATTIEAVNEALAKPEKITERIMADGDVRRTYRGEKANVTISVRDHRLIQANPRGGKK